MSIRSNIEIITDYNSLELKYQNFDFKPSYSSYILLLIRSIAISIFWPIGVGKSVQLLYRSHQLKRNNSKIVSMLADDQSLKVFRDDKIRKIALRKLKYKKRIQALLEKHVSHFEALGFPAPVKKRFPWSSRLPKNLLDNQDSFNTIINTSFYTYARELQNQNEVDDFKELDQLRIKLGMLMRQSKALKAAEANNDVTVIRKIAEMKLVKNCFRGQEAKETIKQLMCSCIPTGLFWKLVFTRRNDRQLYEGKKGALSNIESLNQYADYVDAHNQLVKENKFLIPFFTFKKL